MSIYRGLSISLYFCLIVLVLLSAWVAVGCIKHVGHVEKYAINGLDADPRQKRTYIGAVSADPQLQNADVTVRTLQNTVHCSGTMSLRSDNASKDGDAASSSGPDSVKDDELLGTGTLSCRDGKRLTLQWKPLAPGLGIIRGQFPNGRLIWLTYGHETLAEAKTAITKYFGGKKPEDSGKKPGGPDAPKTPEGEKPPTDSGKDESKKEKEPRWNANGTGFFVTDDGLLITNHHVVDGAVRVGVEDTITRKTYEAEVLAVDKENDLAVVKINAKTRALPLGDSGEVRKGHEVLALGYPVMQALGKEQKPTFGRINSLTGMRNDVTRFQSNATIHGGNSGGPDRKSVV